MTWVRIQDVMPEHPKIVELPPATKWALVELWCYAARHQTDGHVGDGAAKRIAKPKVLTDLTAAGLIHRNGTGWIIHDWLDHNMSKSDYADKKSQAAERQQKWRETHRSPNGTFHE